ncbi:MAG: AmmeMemoRadiSam system protein B [Armatimonadetes bacterium]|nr:AmmeMemoRadiSam system protein B [Armatimonadota bacterium]
MSVRQPAVAGMFYEAGQAALIEEVESCFLGPGGPGRLPDVKGEGARRIVGLVSPHAGFVYSGRVAAHAYLRLAEDGIPPNIVLIGPSHRPIMASVAVADDKAWRTPLGNVPLNTAIARNIASEYPAAVLDSRAHRAEHSIEVQLPFLQYIASKIGQEVKIVPLLIGVSIYDPNASEFVHTLGKALARVLQGENAVVIASTDFSHYESQQLAKRKDLAAIERILALDADGLIKIVREMDISMCGVVPTAVTIETCKGLGATLCHQLAYRTSGDVTGDYLQVVGYASLEIDR